MTSASSSQSSLTGKVAIVTGGNRGIGRAIALRLAGEGAAVMLAARDTDKLREVAGEIEGAGGRAAICSLDLRDDDAAAQLVDATESSFGGIDIVVNNAGATKRGDFLTTPHDSWFDGFALKFHGAVRLTRAAWPLLRQRQGSLVNIVGIRARTPGPADYAVGASVNAALMAFSKSMAELGIADGVQVNAVNPGFINTERQGPELRRLASEGGVDLEEAMRRHAASLDTTRIGEPEDIAALVAFIVSPQGRFLQGAAIDMDGGYTKAL